MVELRAKGLQCTKCGKVFPHSPIYECDACGGILEVFYDYTGLSPQRLSETRALLPNLGDTSLSLGEGNTSLIRAKRLAERLGLENVLLKCEFNNPTGSFKDRPASVGVAKAIDFGYQRVIAASSGNGAAATAAYSARAGLTAVILVPKSTPNEKVLQTQAYGATVIRIDGQYSDCFGLAKQVSDAANMYNVTTTFHNPYTVEGDKVVGYELYEQTAQLAIDSIFVPIGAGPLLVGTYKGFEDYQRIYKEISLPQMVGIQASGNNPIVRAYQSESAQVIAQPIANTIAGGIADGLVGYTKDGDHTLRYIHQSNGFALDVSDSEILEAQHWLAVDEGLFVEPSAAASVAGIARGAREKDFALDACVVAILTGHGLKDMVNIGQRQEIVTVPNNLQRLMELLQEK